MREAALKSWNVFVLQNVKIGQMEDTITSLMKDKFRDRGTIHRGGSGNYDVIYKIDDFHEISFRFDIKFTLLSLPVPRATKPWLRYADGRIRCTWGASDGSIETRAVISRSDGNWAARSHDDRPSGHKHGRANRFSGKLLPECSGTV